MEEEKNGRRKKENSTELQKPNVEAAAAKLLQSCPTLCDPIDSSPPGSAVPGILQARTLEWVAISFSNVVAEVYNNKKCDWIFTYTYTPISKIKTVQQKKVQ